MSSNAIDSQGVKFYIEIGGVMTAIPEVKSWSGPGGNASIIDVTDLDSTAKEKRMGLQDEGSITLTINYIPDNATHAAIRAARASMALTDFRCIFTDAGTTTWDWSGFVTGFTVKGGVDGVVEADVAIEISGAIAES